MISSNILKTILFRNKNLTIIKSNIKTLKKLTTQLNILKPASLSKITKTKRFRDTNFKFNKSRPKLTKIFTNENLINYIVNINFSPTNTLINITDTNGDTQKSFSAGYVKLTKKQKRVQPLAITKIINFLLMKSWFLKHKPVALHFTNVHSYFYKLTQQWLKNRILIQSVQLFNFFPHNGCRPKKLRRLKHRTKRLILSKP